MTTVQQYAVWQSADDDVVPLPSLKNNKLYLQKKKRYAEEVAIPRGQYPSSSLVNNNKIMMEEEEFYSQYYTALVLLMTNTSVLKTRQRMNMVVV